MGNLTLPVAAAMQRWRVYYLFLWLLFVRQLFVRVRLFGAFTSRDRGKNRLFSLTRLYRQVSFPR